MQGVRRVAGVGIHEDSSDDSTWEGGGNTTVTEHTGRRGWDLDFHNAFPGKGRPAELPGGGMPGPSGNEDGNVGALLAPACLRHRGHSGGGKPTPTTVRPVRHAGTLAGPERQAPGHGPV